MRIRSLLSVSALSASAVLAGVLGLAPAALAAGGDAGRLIALTAHDSTQNGSSYSVKPGETVPVQAGVANLGDKPVNGVIVHLWFLGGKERLADGFGNCQYYLDGTAQGAWCEFDQTLAAGGKYSLPPLRVTAPAKAEDARTLVEVVYSKESAEGDGGVVDLTKLDSDVRNFTLVPGTGAKASLTEGSDLVPSKQPGAISFIYFTMVVPSPSTSASSSASPTATVSSPATTTSATAAGQAGGSGGSGGGLAVTGSNAAIVAGVGALLLVGGAAAFLLTRRRRSKFTS